LREVGTKVNRLIGISRVLRYACLAMVKARRFGHDVDIAAT
jgi:hypothetical protein